MAINFRVRPKDSNKTYVLKDRNGYFIYGVEAAIAQANRIYDSKWETVFNDQVMAELQPDGTILYCDIF